MSSSAEYARIKELFQAASELSGEQRKAFLDEQELPQEVRSQVEELLYYDEEPLEFPEPVVDREKLAHVWEEQAPVPDIPGFRIHGLLGEGGMGEVYLAEQIFPRRRVALKLIRGARFSAQALRRFREEIQLLGLLQHPGITQVYAADPDGEDSQGRPYFAMAYIDGRVLTEYADEENLSRDQRIELLAKVCDAVHYAHSQGIIHRDLKPANVLVNEHGQPKVLDFGIARAVGEEFETRTLLTHSEHVVGTMGYMAPEQFSGRADGVGPRADVYALGVMLFELLTGTLPHELEGLNLFEAGQRITQSDATRIGRVVRQHRGELEVIVGKALQRDLTQRYESAAELAADLRRYLAGEPIHAKPPSAIYRSRKFLQRHQRPTTAAGLALGFGIAASFLWLFRPNPLEQPNDSAARFVSGREELLQINGQVVDGRFGSELVSPGDLDGDGVPDLVVGSPGERQAGAVVGAITVYSGAQLDGGPLYRVFGREADGCFGHRIVASEDLNQDEVPDYFVMDGHQHHPSHGRITAISGVDGEVIYTLTARDQGVKFRRNLCTVADRNGDGVRELLVAGFSGEFPPPDEFGGRPRPGVAAKGDGELIVVSGADGAILERVAQPSRMRPRDRFPFKMIEAGDYDGDGIPEIVVGVKLFSAPEMDRSGMAILYSGAELTPIRSWWGDLDQSEFGCELELLDDLSGDGQPEVAIGAFKRDARGPQSGSVFVFDPARASDDPLLRIDGAHFDGRLGVGLASVPDLNGDGLRELAVGAVSYQHVAEYAGAMFVYDLRPALEGGEAQQLFGDFADHGAAGLGFPVRALADFDGDGEVEFGSGMASYGRYQSEGGAVRLYSTRALRARLAD